MYKKLITSCMALAAFIAFAVMPATASAVNDPQLTDTGGLLPIGAKIVGTNVGETLFTNTGGGTTLVSCTTAVMTGEVRANSGGTVEGTITTSDFSGTGSVHSDNNLKECTGSFGNAYITVTQDLCIRSTPAMGDDEFQVHRGTCGGPAERVEFIIGSTTVGACEYRATGNIKGTYTTGAHDTLSVEPTSSTSGAEKISGSFFCPSSGALDMTFTLETEDKETVTIS